jgi:hypothetical protein
MDVKTKYDIDDFVKFKNVIVQGKKITEEVLAGQIQSFTFRKPIKTVNGRPEHEPQTIFYNIKSAYGGSVPEMDIICKMDEKTAT